MGPKQIYSNQQTEKPLHLKNSCYPNSFLPGTLSTGTQFLCTCSMLILIPKIYDIYSTLTNRAGVSGDVFLVSVRVHFDSDLPELFTNCQNFSGNFCGISALKIWRIFLSYSLHILTFSLILKGFNIGQNCHTQK